MSQNNYLKSFVVGSSGPVVLPFFYGVTQLPERKFKLSSYMLTAPLFFGIANVLRVLLKKKLNLTSKSSFLLMSQLSPAATSAWITYRKTYDFPSKARWREQYALLWLAHGFTWLVTIPQLEKLANRKS